MSGVALRSLRQAWHISRRNTSCVLPQQVEVRFAAQGANRSVEVSQAVLKTSTGSNKEPNPPVVVEHERCVYPHVEKCAMVCNFVLI